MRESQSPVSVLRPVDKARKSATPVAATTSAPSNLPTTYERPVNESALLAVRKQLEHLYTVNSPDIHKRVCDYLDNAEGANRMLLDSWAAYGRRDRQRTVDLRLNAAAQSTITPLGFACLISYARAWVDEAEAICLQERRQVACCYGSAGSGSTRPPRESSQSPRARVAVASKRRKR
jgi:hypothetical protein